MKSKTENMKALDYLYPKKEVFECCSMINNTKKSGWFKNKSKAASKCTKEDKENKPKAIYVTLNPCKRDLLEISPNKLQQNKNRTKDNGIKYLRNILIDIDPVRESDTSSTEEEHERAIKKAKNISKFLKRKGFPDVMMVDSGNGAHLICKIKLKNTEKNKYLIRDFIRYVAQIFNTPEVEIDQSVYNPSRLVKLPGTMTRKGEDLPDRPHRRARILHIPKNPKIVPIEKLKALASKAEIQKERATSTKSAFMDVPAYLEHYGNEVKQTKKYKGGTLYALEKCLFNENHAPGKAAIIQSSEGKLYYKCFHNSCRDKKWDDACRKISGTENLGKFFKGVSGESRGELSYKIITGSEMVQKKIKETPLINGLLERYGSLLIVGQTGIMKSMLSLNVALNLAVPPEDGRLYNSFDINKPVRTLFIQSEMGMRATQSRIKLMVSSNPEFEDGLNKIYFPTVGNDCRITGDLKNEGFQESLKDMIFKTKARLIIIDPFISFHSQNENDNAEIRKVLDALTNVCKVAKVASIVVHHTGKNSSDDVFAARGASAFVDWANDILVLNRADKDGQKLIKVTHAKSRNFRPTSPFTLEVTDDLKFRRIQPDDSPKKDVQIVVDTLNDLGGSVEDQGTFKEALAKKGEFSPAKAGRLIAKAVEAGEIEKAPNGKKLGYRLVEIESDESEAE